VPEIVFAHVDPAFGRTEPDEEIQDLLKFSAGLNLALHFLSGAITFDPAVTKVDALLASQIVWLDCLITNVDRTARNTNMLVWQKELWLIDHGAALLFPSFLRQLGRTGPAAVCAGKRPCAAALGTELEAVDQTFRAILTEARIQAIVALLPMNGWKPHQEKVPPNRPGRCMPVS
jgi:hypothetical protein